MLRNTLERAGLADKGISTHSTRLTFITTLHECGYDLHTIQQLTGHRSLSVLAGYIKPNCDRLKKAIASLPSPTQRLVSA
jgi:integrase/recombinase XerD